MANNEEITELITELEKYDLPVNLHFITIEQLFAALTAYINQLINDDFSRLISLLYRLDVSEKKLTELLAHEQQSSAGDIIAHMIIERQLQKIETRKRFRSDEESGEERW